jgi:hypothetical protein
VDDVAVGPEDTLARPKGITPIAIPKDVDSTVFRSVVAAYTTAWRTKGARPTTAEVHAAVAEAQSEAYIGEILVTPEFRDAMAGRGIEIGDTPGLTHQQHLYLMADVGSATTAAARPQKLEAVGASTQQLDELDAAADLRSARKQTIDGTAFSRTRSTMIKTVMVQQALGGSFTHQNFIMETMGEGPEGARAAERAGGHPGASSHAIQRATGRPARRSARPSCRRSVSAGWRQRS